MSNELGEPRLLIDGELCPADGGKVYANIDPATEEPVGEVADTIALHVRWGAFNADVRA